MANVHMIVGSLVIVAYLASLVLNIMVARSGNDIPLRRTISMVAATALLIQYGLGFSLLGSHSITAWHYLIALFAIIPVGFEHGMAAQRPDATERGKLGALANVVTLVLILVAYMIGQSN